MRLNDALKDFRKAQRKLSKVITEAEQRTEARREQIEDLAAKNREDETEKLQAEEALDKLRDLVGDSTDER